MNKKSILLVFTFIILVYLTGCLFSLYPKRKVFECEKVSDDGTRLICEEIN